MKAALQFGNASNPPMQTKIVDAKYAPLWWQERGLMENSSGYGARMTSPYMVRFNNRWRRVYVAIFGNAGTAYIGKPGNWLCTVDLIEESGQ